MTKFIQRVCMLSLLGLTLGTAQAADYRMRVSHQLPPSHHVSQVVERFAEEVKTNSGGKIDVQVFGGEQLFKAQQNHMAVARGQVEAALVISMSWGGTIPEMQVFSIPYLITTRDKLARLPGSPAAELLNRKFEERGVKNIAWLLDANNMAFTSQDKPLLTPNDFRGMKMRGLNKILDLGLIAMGAAPSVMPGSEIYQSLQTGVIDGAGTSVGAVYSRRFFEVQKFAVATAMQSVYDNMIVNPKWWASLPEDMRQVIETAAANAERALLPTTDEIDPAGVERLRQAGMTVFVQTPEQAKVFVDVAQPPVMAEFLKSSPDAPRLVEMIRQL
ncbi:TRAP transporter substrate-binding protein DctP [Pseudomonas sp. S 311-6]|nr:TRAP transporter substrate-binding protein DctP [Pseudomonas sp. S 311-6]